MFAGHASGAERVKADRSCSMKTIAQILGDLDDCDGNFSELEVVECSSDEYLDSDCSSDSDDDEPVSFRRKHGYIGPSALEPVTTAFRTKPVKYKVRKKTLTTE